jgi:hypothetical protein
MTALAILQHTKSLLQSENRRESGTQAEKEKSRVFFLSKSCSFAFLNFLSFFSHQLKTFDSEIHFKVVL